MQLKRQGPIESNYHIEAYGDQSRFGQQSKETFANRTVRTSEGFNLKGDNHY